jgi:hypothetical protein
MYNAYGVSIRRIMWEYPVKEELYFGEASRMYSRWILWHEGLRMYMQTLGYVFVGTYI